MVGSFKGFRILFPQFIQIRLLHLNQESAGGHPGAFLEVMLCGDMVLLAPPLSSSPGNYRVISCTVV